MKSGAMLLLLTWLSAHCTVFSLVGRCMQAARAELSRRRGSGEEDLPLNDFVKSHAGWQRETASLRKRRETLFRSFLAVHNSKIGSHWWLPRLRDRDVRFLDAALHLYKRVCPSQKPLIFFYLYYILEAQAALNPAASTLFFYVP